MNYTLNQLRIFLKVAELQSVTKASEELHLTQPAISIQLKKFQDQFEIPLTEIIGRRLYVTDFGKDIARACERILDEVHNIKYKAEAYKGQLVGQLKISVVSTAKYVIPYFISDFLRQHPAIDLQIDVTNKAQVIQSLEQNQVDLASVSVLPRDLNVNSIELMSNQLYLVVGRSLIGKEKNKKDFLKQVPLIFREKGSATRAAMEEYLFKQKVVIGKKIELTSNEAVKQAVIAGLGCSIMPIIGIKNELKNKDLFIVDQKQLPIKTMWRLIWLNQKKFTPVTEAFLTFIQNEKERIIAEEFNWFSK
ncbi:LysR substrate-binding domain-containing protein [uncultured Croceitalea sp.]|uniref:LysR substrate-binding domain-containing protein n=1 Tax=uncultured Croceitalea sp. TaxID=1798908 RepID=UPI003306251F